MVLISSVASGISSGARSISTVIRTISLFAGEARRLRERRAKTAAPVAHAGKRHDVEN
jgi:hypothetical protein